MSDHVRHRRLVAAKGQLAADLARLKQTMRRDNDRHRNVDDIMRCIDNTLEPIRHDLEHDHLNDLEQCLIEQIHNTVRTVLDLIATLPPEHVAPTP